MKKYGWGLIALVVCLASISWGYVGHQTVARVAENHLTPQAKTAVKQLLGKESLEDVASWADEVRNQPEYKHTASWHFIDVPLGLGTQADILATLGVVMASQESMRNMLNKLADDFYAYKHGVK